MNDKLIPAHRLLPAPSILEKIEALKPGSAKHIIARFEEIARQRRAEMTAAAAKRPSLASIFKRSFSEGFFSCFSPRQNLRAEFLQPRPLQESVNAAINRDWAVTGDDLRAALIEYIENHNLADRLSFDAAERQSLRYVATHFTAPTQRPPLRAATGSAPAPSVK